MKYISTRGKASADSSSAAVITGIAPDGGLFVPEKIPRVSMSEISGMQEMPYTGRAYTILSKFYDDMPTHELVQCIGGAYTKNFNTNPTPLRTLTENLSVLELWHGPTSAFKDMALQLLPHIMVRAVKELGIQRRILILTATSGDTGKAALEAFSGVSGTSVCVYYPAGGVSGIQMLQMHDAIGGNANVVAVEGNFDDTQTGVKQIFADKETAGKLDDMGYMLSSANSINVGRLLPQIVYYFSAYCDLVSGRRIHMGDAVDFVVPTGNFGNILAGWYAKQMGLPVGKLVCASNTNKILYDFINTGAYDANRGFFKTISPSMDILISSNLERLLFEASGRDSGIINEITSNLKKDSAYSVTDAMLGNITHDFAAGWADDTETRHQISKVWNEYHYLIDPHTAVAFSVLEKAYKPVRQTVILSTANPYKFAGDVLPALGGQPGRDDFESIDKLEEITGIKVPINLSSIRFRKVSDAARCGKNQMREALLSWLVSGVD